jgi:putative flavoprotein involved in K+ transport
MQHTDVLIIGGGQAGLASAYYLLKQSKPCLIIEKNERLGDQWRKRYDSLVLFATRRYSHIPGLEMPGDQQGYPTKDEVADYLEEYAKHFSIPVKTNAEVIQVEQHGQGFIATLDNEQQIHFFSLVIATGGFQVPNIPKFAKQLPSNVVQFTPENYQRPSQLPKGNVLIVGDGATGRQVAKEIVKTHNTTLATGQPRKIRPQQVFGKDYFWWLDKLGILKVTKNSWFGRYMIKNPPFPGVQLQNKDLQEQNIDIVGRLEKIEGQTAYFSDGNKLDVDAIVWALGYHFDYSWLKIKDALVKDDIIEDRGVCMLPGIYTIGRPWQWTRGSSTLTGVGDDAEYIANHCIKYLERNQLSSQQLTNDSVRSDIPHTA